MAAIGFIYAERMHYPVLVFRSAKHIFLRLPFMEMGNSVARDIFVTIFAKNYETYTVT